MIIRRLLSSFCVCFVCLSINALTLLAWSCVQRLYVSSAVGLVLVNCLVISWLLEDLSFSSVLLLVMIISNVTVMMFRYSVWHLQMYLVLNSF